MRKWCVGLGVLSEQEMQSGPKLKLKVMRVPLLSARPPGHPHSRHQLR